ncbi:Protein SLG1 [Neonectria magnoliae]|uniref:Protein SLG1 n=1 Tax=Neonectria magnoliae TaxID=2732573 RepID=A0ABR1IK58_9HYPO
MITHLTRCYCADTYPARVCQLDDDQCDYPCPGYPMEACGSLNGAFSVFNTGLEVTVENDDDKPTSSSFTSASTTTANAGLPTSKKCHSALSDISDFAQEISAAASRLFNKIRVLFNQCIGRLDSDATKQSSEETEDLDL